MAVKEYTFKLTQISIHSPTMVAKSSMSKFVSGVFDIEMNEWRKTILIKKMDITHLMTHA